MLSDFVAPVARLFLDGYLTEVLRTMSNDPTIDQKVRKKLVRILAAWHSQYKDDPSMKIAANLYKQYKNDADGAWRLDPQTPTDDAVEAAKNKSKEVTRKAKEEAERLKKEEKKKSKESAGKPKTKRKPFNFEEVCLVFLETTSVAVCIMTDPRAFRRNQRSSRKSQVRRNLQITSSMPSLFVPPLYFTLSVSSDTRYVAGE